MQGTWLDRVHGISDDGCQLGHGVRANVRGPTVVDTVCIGAAGDVTGESGTRIVFDGDSMQVDSVSCGLDHMVAIISVAEGLLHK
jgi:hypothetical protein